MREKPSWNLIGLFAGFVALMEPNNCHRIDNCTPPLSWCCEKLVGEPGTKLLVAQIKAVVVHGEISVSRESPVESARLNSKIKLLPASKELFENEKLIEN